MNESLHGTRILIYSHDSFGLGHLRRCRTIAHALVDQFAGLKVLIVSGSPIIGSFDFKSRVDFVRIPGVVKLRGGDYTSLSDHIDLSQTLQLRASIMEQAADTFAPDLFIVDKEPLGLRGEVTQTLKKLRDKGVPTVLGLRDILDDPVLLNQEWSQRGKPRDLEFWYDEIWVFGSCSMGNPLAELGISEASLKRMVYTGYLRRAVPSIAKAPVNLPREPFLLVTPGGGGDGETLVDWVLSALEQKPRPTKPVVIVLGPFMPQAIRQKFQLRAEALDQVQTIVFNSNMELVMERAAGVVAMGGYNTFCEILSLDKPALLIPRSTPRMEQTLRAHRASSLGLVSMLDGDGDRSAEAMAQALRRLERQPLPSAAGADQILSGLEVICERTRGLLSEKTSRHRDIA
jgi:predicted glycosyltransferase